MISSVSLVILTSYFSKKKHPNAPNDAHVVGRTADGTVASNEISYIKPWYESVKKLEIKGVVFHDALTDKFVEEYSTDYISFKKVGDFEYSNNDYRFFCFDQYLRDNDSFDYVFHADASDVTVVKNPTELIESHDGVDYFACQDSIKLHEFNYMWAHEKYGFEDRVKFLLNYSTWDLINMGVIGGRYQDMQNFYRRFREVRESMGDPDFNSDMWLCQYLLRSQFQHKNFIMGEPVCSEFKKFQNDREDVYFIHK